MDERRSFLQDEDDDQVLFEKLQEHVLEKYPNPGRIGCIDRETLKVWVNSPEELDLSDPKYLHVLKCAECTRELIELRKERNDKRGRVQVPAALRKKGNHAGWRWVGIAAVVLCCLGIGGVAYWRIHSPNFTQRTVPATPVAETIDLSQAGTTRGGQTSTVPPVVLPRRVVTAHVLLPYFSPGGSYFVAVTKDQNAGPAEASGRATANVDGIHTDLTVSLDLRSLPPGTYFLVTVHESDEASYYYPLTLH